MKRWPDSMLGALCLASSPVRSRGVYFDDVRRVSGELVHRPADVLCVHEGYGVLLARVENDFAAYERFELVAGSSEQEGGGVVESCTACALA